MSLRFRGQDLFKFNYKNCFGDFRRKQLLKVFSNFCQLSVSPFLQNETETGYHKEDGKGADLFDYLFCVYANVS